MVEIGVSSRCNDDCVFSSIICQGLLNITLKLPCNTKITLK